MEQIIYALLILMAVVLYAAALIAFAVFLAPFIAAGMALFIMARWLAGYIWVVHGVIFVRSPEFQTIPPYRPEDEDEPAYRQYFFGPAIRDLRQVITLSVRHSRDMVQDRGQWVISTFFTAPSFTPLAAIPLGVALAVGLAVGAVAAAGLLTVAVTLHAVAVILVQGIARAAIGVLRATDTAVLRAKDIRGMLCPWCYQRNEYPSYECPECHRTHRDIRPGRYGLRRRRCQCDERLPTLLLLGSHRLPAICLHCGRRMSDETGRFSELVLPLLGGRSAGKTRLMAAMIMSIEEQARQSGDSVSLADNETRHSFEVLREVLRIDGNVLATSRELPRAHSLQIATPQGRRLLHMFDAAGERMVDEDRTDELRYLRYARVFLFVLDPMSVPAFWSQLTEPERHRIDRALASDAPPELVFQQSVQTILRMGTRLRRARLAVAISKADLIRHAGIVADRTDSSDWAERWVTNVLGQGNLIRAMRNEFAEVRFFFTAAMIDAGGHVDESIAPVVSWCMGEGRSVRRRGVPSIGAHRRPLSSGEEPAASGL